MKIQPREIFLALGLFAASLPLFFQPPAALRDFAALPILEGGRVKPVDSFARNALLVIYGKQTFQSQGKNISAVQWLADALWRPKSADDYSVFTIDDPEVLGLLGLNPVSGRAYSYNAMASKRGDISSQAQAAEKIESVNRSRFQASVVNLELRLSLYERIKNTLMFSEGLSDPAQDFALLKNYLPVALRAKSIAAATKNEFEAFKAISLILERYKFLASAAAFKPIAPSAVQSDSDWLSIGEAIIQPRDTMRLQKAVDEITGLGRSWQSFNNNAFTEAAAQFSSWTENERPKAARLARLEVIFNRAQPFISGMALYLAGFLLIISSWATRRPFFVKAYGGILGAAFLVHTIGLVARIVLQGRPPVTNLYSSAVFVGWIAAILGLLAERVHRRGLAAASAAATGFMSLLVAHHLTGSGDTMEMMRAVLDSNFWLATHVVTITIGYAGTFVAGSLGLTWIVRRHWVRHPQPETSKALYSLTYAAIAFSLLFSFIGTVLGGIWADQSWGRFWGWDPKENGALLIVLWNSIILHARWGGRVRERGVMMMAVIGNCVTSWSWFGVNMLGVGLHSYGFMDKAFWWLIAFVSSQLIFVALGLLPVRFWEDRSKLIVPGIDQ